MAFQGLKWLELQAELKLFVFSVPFVNSIANIVLIGKASIIYTFFYLTKLNVQLGV